MEQEPGYNTEASTDQTKCPDNLVNDHWDYIFQVLEAHGEEWETIEKVGFHYKTAFAHGWKHAMEAKGQRRY
jgi:hypothetical protein